MKKTYPLKSLSIYILFIILLLFIVPVTAQDQYFTDETDSRIPQIPAICNCVDAADIDNDGDWDVFGNAWEAIPPYNPYFLYINDGTGFFEQANQGQLPDTMFGSAGVGFGDVDNDGDYDIYIVSENYQDLLYINDGDGYFSDETNERFPDLSCYNGDFVFGDFSNDSYLDIIVVEAYITGINHYLVNDGGGYFEDMTDIYMPVDTIRDMYGETGDLDNDLDLDLLIAWWTGSPPAHIRGLLNQDGYFVEFEQGFLEDRDTRWLDYADLDGDGDLDVVISAVVSIGILINYDSLFIDESSTRLPEIPGTGFNMPGFGDFDNDGDFDIYLTRATQRADYYLLNDGNGYFELADERIPDTRASSRWAEPIDADGDGDLDIFIGCTGDGQQRLLINHSTPDTISPVIIAEDLPLGDVDSLAEYQVKISAYDNISVEKGALTLSIFYSINGGDFVTDTLVHCGGTIFNCFIPGQESGTVIDYYIKVEDKMGNYITSPVNAPDSLHHFEVYPPSQIHENDNSKNFFTFEIYPNPSNSEFSVSYFADENLKLNIYDLSGRKLHSESLPFNASNTRQRWYWQGWSELASGIYFIELSKANRREVKKAVLIR